MALTSELDKETYTLQDSVSFAPTLRNRASSGFYVYSNFEVNPEASFSFWPRDVDTGYSVSLKVVPERSLPPHRFSKDEFKFLPSGESLGVKYGFPLSDYAFLPGHRYVFLAAYQSPVRKPEAPEEPTIDEEMGQVLFFTKPFVVN